MNQTDSKEIGTANEADIKSAEKDKEGMLGYEKKKQR